MVGPHLHKILCEEARGSGYSLRPVTMHASMLSHFTHVQLFETLWPGSFVYGVLQARILEGVGCHALLQGIFPSQGSNLHFLQLLLCRQILYH